MIATNSPILIKHIIITGTTSKAKFKSEFSQHLFEMKWSFFNNSLRL